MGVPGRAWVVSPHLLIAQAVAAALRSVGTPAEARGWESAIRDSEPGDLDAQTPRHLVVVLDGVEDGKVVEQVTRLVELGDVRIAIVTTAEAAFRWGGLVASESVDVVTVTTSVVQLAEVVERLTAGGSSMDRQGRLALQESWARAHARRRQLASLMATLTPQQRRVLEFLASGRRVSEVGDLMGVANGTVRSHVKALRAKLGARTQLEAVALFHQMADPVDGTDLVVPRPRPARTDAKVLHPR